MKNIKAKSNLKRKMEKAERRMTFVTDVKLDIVKKRKMTKEERREHLKELREFV